MNHVTIVTGFGRCGSSLVMQMLEAGGHPISGDWPSFEDRAAAVQGPLLGGSSDCMEQFVGHAVKVLDLHTGTLPRGFAYRAVWCTRDHREQGKSQAKFLAMMTGMPLGRDAARQFERSYGKDHPKLAAALNRVGADVLHLRFEDLLMRPVETAQRIAVFLGLPTEAVGRMAAAVVPRNARCAPGLDMELQLLAGRERTAGVSALDGQTFRAAHVDDEAQP